jgi:phage terminase Nu1 subunit (DNA packaging protein)
MITDDGKVDVEISDMLLDQFSDSGTQTTAQDRDRESLTTKLSIIGDYSEQRALLTKYKADKAKLDLDIALGRVVDIDIVTRAAHDTARRTRDTLLNMPDRLAPILAAETDVFKIRTILDDEFRKSLDELYNEFIPKQKESHSA